MSEPQVALVTGGSKGIGFACALGLARQGYRVFIAARHEAGLQQAQQQAAQADLYLETLRLDVSDLKSVEQQMEQVCAQAGLDVLVHAAGTGAFSPVDSVNDPRVWQQVIRTNLDGAYYCARSALLAMHQTPVDHGRRLVFISSVLGLKGMANSHAYCASKHGVNGLVRALAQDTAAQNITINSVCPGWVNTDMAQEDFKAMSAHYHIPAEMLISEEIQAVPIQRWIRADEVAAMVSYLCSEAAAAVTGQCLEISGG